MTYVIAAEWTARAGAEETILDVLRAMTAPTRAEPGNGLFHAHRDVAEPRRFLIYERYVDEAAFREHQATPHYHEHVIARALPNLEHRHLRVLEPIPGQALR